MYDYLAKIILLGPSGSGKYVIPLRNAGLQMLIFGQIVFAASICQERMEGSHLSNDRGRIRK